MTDDSGHFFLYLSAIHISSKCLLKCFDGFYWVVGFLLSSSKNYLHILDSNPCQRTLLHKYFLPVHGIPFFSSFFQIFIIVSFEKQSVLSLKKSNLLICFSLSSFVLFMSYVINLGKPTITKISSFVLFWKFCFVCFHHCFYFITYMLVCGLFELLFALYSER